MALSKVLPVSKETSSCGLFTLPRELKDQIYTEVLYLNRPVRLRDSQEIYNWYAKKHEYECVFSNYWPHNGRTHPNILDIGGTNMPGAHATWCINPFTKEKTKIGIPDSVLSIRLVCKQMNEDMMLLFWQLNDFHFETSSMARLTLGQIPRHFVNEIQEMTFKFQSSYAKDTFQGLAGMCPNLKVLHIIMHHDDVKLISLNKGNTLRTAGGMALMSKTILNLKTLELAGTDQIKQIDSTTGQEVWRVVDVNHEDAVGPWLKSRMVEPPQPKGLI
jgi:hypothetical protein